MKKEKKYIVIFYCITISFLILLAIFNRYDLSISIALYDKDSVFGLLFAMFGEWPMNVSFLFSSVFLFVTRPKANTLLHISGFLGWGLSSIVGAFYTVVVPVEFFLILKNVEPSQLLILLIIPVIIIFVLLVRRLKKEQYILLRKTSKTIVLYFYVANLTTYVIKLLWGRLRFCDMQQPINEFTAWYLPQGFTGNYSFISGSTMNACFCLLLVSVVTTISPRLGSKEKILYILASAWIMCVALSRVIYGAHFASDVTMGAILGVTLFLALKRQELDRGFRLRTKSVTM